MAENTQAVAKEEKPELQIVPLPAEYLGKVVTRNEVTEPLVPHTLLKGENAGNQYLGFNFKVEQFDDVVKFWGGKEAVINELNGIGKKKAQDVWKGCKGKPGTENEGVFNLDQFLVEIQSFDTAGLPLREINAKLDELNATLMKEVTNPENFKPENLVAFQAKMAEMNESVNAYKAMAAKRSSRGRKDEDAEPATVG
jgi:hypothetical protein